MNVITPFPLAVAQRAAAFPRWLKVLLLAFLFAGASTISAEAFVHPGGLHNQEDLDRMKAHVLAGDHPWIDGWNRLITDSQAQNTYVAAPLANMGQSRQRADADAHAAYLNTIRWYITGDTSYAECAVRICNAWSATVNQVPTGTDIPGLSGIPVFDFAMVGELLRVYPGWAPADFDRFKTMMLTWWYPVCHDFLTNHNNTCVTHWWANWDACNTGALIAIGVLCDNQAIFDEGVNYFKSGIGAGSAINAIYYIHPGGLGQWQESGRDQEHAQLGVGLLSAACEIAWKQGVDLYGFDDNRLLKGAEYVALTNLSRPVPFAFYNNCDNVRHFYVSINGLGRLDDRPVWELIYNHYAVRKGMSTPYTRKIAELMRPEHGSIDHFGYGTLTFTLDAAASPYPSSPTPPIPTDFTATAGVGRVMLQWNPSDGDTAQGYRLQRATTSGGPYTTIASWTDNTYPKRTDTSVINGTTYYYVVAAINQSGTSDNSPEVSATPQATGGLPDGWARQDVGSVNSAGSAGFAPVAGNTFVVGGNGTGIGGSADSFSFAYRAVTGDSTVTGRLYLNGNIKAGFIMRESLDANARAASLTLGDVGGRETFFGWRSAAGGPMSFTQGNDYTWTPVWYKLQRSGDTFTASQSLDGIEWFVVDSGSVPMSSTYFVGLAVVGGTATFDNISVDGTFLAGPPTNLSAVNGPNQVTLTWTASTGATSYNVKRATAPGGPYTTIATGVAGTSYVDSGLTNGSEFFYVVSTTQGTYETANSNEVLGLPGDIAFIWSATPASELWNVGSNWVGGAAPSDGASLAFAASAITSLNNNLTNLAVNRVTFNSGAGAFTLAGNAITLGGNVLNASGSNQTISLPIALDGTRTFTANTGQLTISGVISDGVAGSGLIKGGSQPLSLTGQNTFSGDVTHNTGTLTIAGTGTGTAGAPTSGALGRGTLKLGGGLLTSSGAAKVFNNVVVQAGSTVNIASNTANITLAGNISGSGNINETGANTGGTHLNGDNSGFTGTFTSNGNGSHRMRFNSPTSGSANATWVLNNNNTDGYGLNFGTGKISFGALSGGGQFRSDAALNTVITLSVGALNTDTSFTGVMVANSTRFIGLEKVGTGRLTLTGNNTFNGPTTVVSGALIVTNGYRSAVAVNGGTFGGTGSSNSAVTVATGAALAPGNPGAGEGIGTFTTTGAVTLNAGARFAVQLNSNEGTADKLVAGSISLGGAVLDASDLGSDAFPAGASITLIDNTGENPVSGFFDGLDEGAMFTVGANLYRITYVGGTGNDVVLTVIVPTTIQLGGLAQIYDGTPRVVTAITTPAGVPVGITYDGNASAPINAGSYAVISTVADPNYIGSTTGTLVIEKATAALTLGGGGSQPVQLAYDGSTKTPGYSTNPSGLPVTFTYDGSTTPPTLPGTYHVVATVNDPNYTGATESTLVITIAVLVRHAPTISSIVDGSMQVLVPESFTLKGGATLSGDVLLPGMPSLLLNGNPTYAGLKYGPGAATPTDYTLTLGGGAVLRYLVRRVDAIDLPTVATPPAPTGTRSVTLKSAGQSAGDFATLGNLTLKDGVGAVTVPPGTYGAFSASGNSGFVFGVAGATEPAAYNLQSLTLSGTSSSVQIVGPVVLTLANGTTIAGTAGNAAHPEWLELRLASGGATLNSGATLRAIVSAPSGTVTVNDGATLVGRVAADRFTLNTNGLFDEVTP